MPASSPGCVDNRFGAPFVGVYAAGKDANVCCKLPVGHGWNPPLAGPIVAPSRGGNLLFGAVDFVEKEEAGAVEMRRLNFLPDYVMLRNALLRNIT